MKNNVRLKSRNHLLMMGFLKIMGSTLGHTIPYSVYVPGARNEADVLTRSGRAEIREGIGNREFCFRILDSQITAFNQIVIGGLKVSQAKIGGLK